MKTSRRIVHSVVVQRALLGLAACVLVAASPRAAHGNLIEKAAQGAYDLTLKPILKLDFGDLKRELLGFFKDPGAIVKKLGGLGEGSLKKPGDFVRAVKVVLDKAKGLGSKVLPVIEKLLGLPELIKKKAKQLIWMELDKPTSKKNDKAIERFFRTELKDVRKALFDKNKFLAWAKPFVSVLEKFSGDMLVRLGTPVVRWLQFLRTKVRAGLVLMMKAVMKRVSKADAIAGMGKLQIPAFLVKPLTNGIDLLARTVGSFGSYALKLSPELESVVKEIVGALADSSAAMDDAMGAVVGASATLTGDKVAWSDETKAWLSAQSKRLRAHKGSAAHKAALRGLSVRAAQMEYERAYAVKGDKVKGAVQKIFEALGDTFVSMASPAIDKIALGLRIALQVSLPLMRKVVTYIADLIPEAGGIIAAVWDIVAAVVLPFIPALFQAATTLITPIVLDVVREEIVAFADDISKMWDNPKERATLEGSMKFLSKFKQYFELANKTLGALRSGLEKGVGAMLEGPIMSMLLKRLPPGLGEVIAQPLGAALSTLFSPDNLQGGKFKLDIKAVLANVLEALRAPLTAFLTRNLPKGGGLTAAFVGGADKAWASAMELLKGSGNDFGKLLTGNVIRNLVADFVEGSTEGVTEFLAGRIKACDFRDNTRRALAGLSKLVREGDKLLSMFSSGGGFAAVVPLLVPMLKEPLAALLTCGIKNEKFKRRILPALDEAATFFSEEANVKKLMEAGFRGAFGLLVKVVRFPIAGLVADGLGDPALEGEISDSLQNASEDVFDDAFKNAFAQDGLRGVLLQVAKLARGPIVGWLSRRFALAGADPRFGETIAKTYDAFLATPEKLAQGGLKLLVAELMLPWAQLAFGKAVDAFGGALDRAKDQWARLVVMLQARFPAVEPLEAITLSATEAGKAAFVSGAKACVDALQAAEVASNPAQAISSVVSCLTKAGADAFKGAVEAGKEAATQSPAAPEPSAE